MGFLEKKKAMVDTSVALVTKLVTDQHTQMRRLDAADKNEFTVSQDFTTQPPIDFCHEQFAKEMLIKPSTANNLVDLTAELNALKLDDKKPFGEDDVMDDQENSNQGMSKGDPSGWTLAMYYDQ